MRLLKWAGLSLLGLIALIAIASVAVGLRFDIPAAALMEKYAGPESRFVEIDGLKVHYRDRGPREAPALVLLHGSSASLHAWEGWAAELKDQFRVISLDLPAHGLTGPWPQGSDYSLNAYADFLGRFADRLGLKRFSLAGNSLGGTIAWTYAGRNPQRVEKLILIDAAGYPRPGSRRFFGLLRLPGAELLVRWFTPRFVVAAAIRSIYGDSSKVDDALIDRYCDLVLRAGNRGAILTRFAQYAPDLALLKALDMPVLVMWGAKDRVVLPADAFRFQNDIADAGLQIYEDVGHVAMEEIPARSAADARAFLLDD